MTETNIISEIYDLTKQHNTLVKACAGTFCEIDKDFTKLEKMTKKAVRMGKNNAVTQVLVTGLVCFAAKELIKLGKKVDKLERKLEEITYN